MAAKEELNCVSCESTFDAGPNGGFCPDCDTPHPDYEMPSSDDGDEGASESGEEETEADEQASETDEQLSEPEADESECDAEAETEDSETVEESIDDQCSSCGTTVDPTASFCSNCGSELEAESEAESDELTECPNCSNSVDDESFCPNCGTDLDAIRTGDEEDGDGDDADTVEEVDDGDDDAEDVIDDDDADGDGDEDDGDAEADEADDTEAEEADDSDEAEKDDSDGETSDAVTLVIAGESYRLEDGDTFGRQDKIWLDDLVAASGGRDEASYISGEHLEFEIAEDGVYLTDLSTNGTSHNGEPLDGGRTKLEDGDTLELAGRAEITVEL